MTESILECARRMNDLILDSCQRQGRDIPLDVCIRCRRLRDEDAARWTAQEAIDYIAHDMCRPPRNRTAKCGSGLSGGTAVGAAKIK